MKNARAPTFVAALALVCSQIAFTNAVASPWGRPSGDWLNVTKADYFSVFEREDGGASDFKRINTETYVEYGLRNRLTVGGKVIYGTSWIAGADTLAPAAGVSEISVFLQQEYRRTEKDAFSVRVKGIRQASIQSGVRQGLQSDGFDAGLSVLYGRNFQIGSINSFSVIDFSFSKRFGIAADNIELQSTLGLKPSEKFLVLFDSFSTISLRNARDGGADYDVVKVQPSLVFQISPKYALQIGYNREIASRNLKKGNSFLLGLWAEF